MKLRICLFCLVFSFALIIYSCSSTGHSTETTYELSAGEYTYTIWDSVSNKILEGEMNISTVSKTAVTGSYKTSVIYDSTFPGVTRLQGGDFKGKFLPETGMLSINMNPKVADYNVYFSGKSESNKITGDWTLSTFSGTKNKGKFQAIKK
jgi:hypothetical protein